MVISNPHSSVSSQADADNAVLSANDLIHRLWFSRQTHFTGQLTVKLHTVQTPQWDLYFHRGILVAGTSTMHPIRRWRRQFSHHCPNLDVALVDSSFDQHHPWDYQPLMRLVRQGKLSLQQLAAIIEGVIVEILFDLIQAANRQGCNLQLQLTLVTHPQYRLNSGLIEIWPTRVLNQAVQTWKIFCEAGLEHYSVNRAPVIWDADELRRQTSFLVYCNMMSLVDGDRTLRDLAVKSKQNITALTQSILPYIHKEIMGLVEVKDLIYQRSPNGVSNSRTTSTNPPVPAVQARSSEPMVVYVEDSRFDCLAMGQILNQIGCRFINVREPLQALPIVFEHKPDLIFLDLQMPIMNGYEICAHIRRAPAFKETPVIIVTSSDGLVDRVRAKLIGATDFIAKPIESMQVRTILQQYLGTIQN
ncbi:MAG: response regulator [Leptolyngbyaceae cyanobacterium MO_188.B28]|nr:response regulator [Leptolyngbyaceae cyanobacterium MO_188.B28]